MKKQKTHSARLDALAGQREAAARLELARAEFALADALWRHEVTATDYSDEIARARERVARAKAAL